MKIGIDARMYRSSVAGIGRYSKNLVKNLLEIDQENLYILFMTPDDIKEFEAEKITAANVKVVSIDIPHYSIAEQRQLASLIENENLDLMHFLNFNLPLNYQGKFIATIHDLTLFFYPDTAKKTNFIKRLAFRHVMKKACQKAVKIIAVSNSTKKDIEEMLKIDPEKISVIYEAADDKTFHDVESGEIDELKRKHQIDKPIILYVGQYRSHKNIERLVSAFNIIRDKVFLKLVLVGNIEPDFKKTIDKSPYKEDIVMPGFVTDNELSAWYKMSGVFAFPSLYEGFGLPGLEAMAAGMPVVASGKSSLPEIYQNAAVYFDPLNEQDIADKIKLVLSDDALRTKLITQGKVIASGYSWRKTAEETLKIYLEIGSQNVD